MLWFLSPYRAFFTSSEYYTGPTLTDQHVKHAEEVLGYKLPASYLKLLRVKNGGVPRNQCYPTSGDHWTDNHLRVTVVFGIGGEWGIDSDQLGSRKFIRQGGFPEVGIVIGWTADSGHEGIMLDYSLCGTKGEPRVILVDGESDTPEGVVLADDFSAFLKRIRDCRSYDRATAKGMEEFRKRRT